MHLTEKRRLIGKTLGGVAMVWTLGLGQASAQSWQPLQYIEPGTSVQVRTTQSIDQSTMDGRVFTGVVDADVRDAQGRLALIKGATAELVVRTGPDNELYLDLDSITVNGQRYAVDATRHPVAKGGIDIKNSGIGNNEETVKNVGGGALLGTIIGAIAGGLLGHEVAGRRGDRTTGTIIGGAVGAVAGRAIDKGDGRC